MTSEELNAKGCEGYLWRQSSILKRWKKGRYRLKHDGTHYTMECIEDDDFSVKFETCDVKPLGHERMRDASYYLVFEVLFHKCVSRLCNKEETPHSSCFRARSLIDMRTWLVQLGIDKSLPGIMSNGMPHTKEHQPWTGQWDESHPAQALQEEIKSLRTRALLEQRQVIPNEPPPPYEAIAQQFHQVKCDEIPNDYVRPPPQSPTEKELHNTISLLGQKRRECNDTYLPPYGESVNYPVNLGYGAEIGLPPSIQKCWDPFTQKCFYVDNEKGVTFWSFEVPKKATKRTVTHQRIHYGGGKVCEQTISAKSLRDPVLLDEMARRVRLKPHGVTIEAQGTNGKDGCDGRSGSNGQAGEPGKKGFHGHEGEPGCRGKDGCHGHDGHRGGHGTAASDLWLCLDGDSDTLTISGSIEKQVHLGGPANQQVIYVKAHGGSGGQGGNGGQGGAGGHGGDGGKGGRGCDIYMAGNSVRGADGGDGGCGGHGGNGGPGGKGGSGGDAGNGGHVTICASDPRLFVLCEIDVKPGKIGKCGRGGAGGLKGQGGKGGKGGCGGMAGVKEDGTRGVAGYQGKLGLDGIDGLCGGDGDNGLPAQYGSLLWTVVDPVTRNVTLETAHRYDIRTNGFEVHSEVDDGIFEPNERIYVTTTMLENIGGMDLPDGATLTYVSTDTVNFEPNSSCVPILHPGGTCSLTSVFTGRIFDAPPPNKPGPYKATANIISTVSLLGRPFDSATKKEVVTVQYPIQLTSLRGPSQLGRGEQTDLEIQVKNISQCPYGDQSSQSGGLVMLKVRLDRRLLPYMKENQSPRPYTLRFNSRRTNSVEIWLHHLGAGDALTITIPCVLEHAAELFDKCLWQAELYLRGKLIEYNQETIRVTPYYIQRAPPADLLFITGPEISRDMFVYWQRLFQALNLTVDFWDTERQQGLSTINFSSSRHQSTWVNQFQGQTILYPYYNPALLKGADVATHFHGDSWRDYEHDDLDSGMILITKQGAYKNRSLCAVFNHILTENVPSARLGSDKSRFCLFCSSGRGNSDKKIQTFVKKLEKTDSSHHYCIFSKQFCSYISSEKFSSSHCDIRRLPVARSARLLMSGFGEILQLGEDDPFNTPDATQVPLGSYFGQMLLALIFSLPIKTKTRLLRQSSTSDLTFSTPWGASFTVKDLVGLSLEDYLAFDLVPGSRHPSRLESLVDAILADPTTFTNSAVAEYVYTAGRSLLKKAKNNSHFKYLHPKAAKKYQEIVNILKSRGDADSQSELEFISHQSVNSKDRLKLDHLLDWNLFSSPNRFTAKDSIYEVSEIFI